MNKTPMRTNMLATTYTSPNMQPIIGLQKPHAAYGNLNTTMNLPQHYAYYGQHKIKLHTPIPTKTNWNGRVATFETFKQTLESWAFQNGMHY